MSKPLRVAICAAGHGSAQAEWLDKTWERWGVNATWSLWKNPEDTFARWFELHRRSYLKWEHKENGNGQNASGYGHFTWLRALRRLPIYVQEPKDWPELPTARAFPFTRVQALATAFANYHASSIDWMLAYAITEGAREIALYGVEQDHSAEPHGARACVEFWAGFAVARGIKVWSVDGSTFRLAQLTFTDVPYALDPKWLPRSDITDRDSMIQRMSRQLARAVDKDLD